MNIHQLPYISAAKTTIGRKNPRISTGDDKNVNKGRRIVADDDEGPGSSVNTGEGSDYMTSSSCRSTELQTKLSAKMGRNSAYFTVSQHRFRCRGHRNDSESKSRADRDIREPTLANSAPAKAENQSWSFGHRRSSDRSVCRRLSDHRHLVECLGIYISDLQFSH